MIELKSTVDMRPSKYYPKVIIVYPSSYRSVCNSHFQVIHTLLNIYSPCINFNSSIQSRTV